MLELQPVCATITYRLYAPNRVTKMRAALTDFERLDWEKTAALFSMLGNSKRLQILMIITKFEVSVGRLAQMTGLSQSALSQHLAKLRENNVIQYRRDAQTVYYRCVSSTASSMVEALRKIYDEPVALAMAEPVELALDHAYQKFHKKTGATSV